MALPSNRAVFKVTPWRDQFNRFFTHHPNLFPINYYNFSLFRNEDSCALILLKSENNEI